MGVKREVIARLSALALGLAVFGAASFATAAALNGGSSIASAPELMPGEIVDGGGSPNHEPYEEYWRLTLTRADRVALTYKSTNQQLMNLCLISPSLDDLAFDPINPKCMTETGSLERQGTLTYIPASSGRYTLMVQGEGGDYPTDLAYELRATVKHYTRVSLAPIGPVRSGASVVVSGTLNGAAGGQIVFQTRTASTQWKAVGGAVAGASGHFAFKTPTAAPGTYRIRAVYQGDATHLAASSVVTFRVTS